MITLRYLLRRIFYMAITLFAAITLNFLLPRLVPGNPALLILLTKYRGIINPSQLKLIESELNLRGTMWQQYVGYLSSLVHGNLGVSYYYYPQTVSSIILEHLPWTLFLLGTATLVSVIIGVFIGSYSGWKRGLSDTVLQGFSVSLTAVPYFWLGLIFQLAFAVIITINGYHIFPVAHAYGISVTPGPNLPFFLSVMRHAALPLITLIITTFPGFALLMRNTVITVLDEDYVLLARAKGLQLNTIRKNYVNKNAILPVATSVALAFAGIVGGAFLVEEVFSYPGIGFTLYNAVTTSDYPLIEGIFLIITFTIVIANFLVDILYAYLDPRVILK
ncbi:MAG: ABC transporter permease [Candidatus Thermoplasmatota archaeon]|jgi:peptide/nickel transport system permease protein|nr:ABC transporter permease [Candidatus Thermoplasmatota archaeon]